MERKRLQNYINGEWVTADAVKHNEIINPATGERLCDAPVSGKSDLNSAVRAAHEAFHEWRNTPAVARARYLHRLAALMEENFNELSICQTREHGKTIDESRGETRRAIEMVEVAAGIPSLMQGYNLQDIAIGIDETAIYEPLGVFCCIAPFNFPFMVPLWFLPFAVAAGNTFIVKPSPRTPMSQVELFKLLDEVGFPPGVVNMVHGETEVADALIEHPDVRGVTFVGSTPIAKEVYKKCGQFGKRVIAQAGAKNYIVLMADASIDQAMVSLIASFYGNSGQRCLSGANLIIVGENKVYEEFLEKFVNAASAIRVGNGLDETVQMGPLQNAASKERVVRMIEKGIEDGAKLRLDGRNLRLVDDLPEACFLNASVFEDVHYGMTCAQEEIFGPVASVLRAKDLSESVDMINQCPYGNAASIFTNSGKWARAFRHEVNVGNLGINVGIVAPMAFFPFGGRKDSFFGVLHGQGRDALRFFTDPKILIERWF